MPLDPVALDDPHVPAHNAERDAINDLEEAIATKMELPGFPSLGSLVRWNGDNWVATQMRLFEGSGSPEGVVSAPVGSRYVDVAATGGVAEWFKASGAGNTGWSPQNTGIAWTNFALDTGWAHESGNPAQVSLLNGVVFFRGTVHRNSGSNVTVGTIPTTMAPPKTLYGMARVGSTYIPLGITTGGTVTISGAYDNGTDLQIASIAGTPYRKN